MIFKTINNDLISTITGTETLSNKVGIFGRSFADIRMAYQADGLKGMFNSFSRVLTKTDIEALENFNTLIEQNATLDLALEESMVGTSKAAIELAKSAEGGKVALEGLKGVTIGEQLAMMGLRAAVAAANMAIVFGISFVISKISEEKQKLNDALKEQVETSKNLEETTKKIEQSYITYQKYIKQTSLTSNEEDNLQTAINDVCEVLDIKAEKLDKVKQKTDEYTKSLKGNIDEELKSELKEVKKGSVAAQTLLKDNVSIISRGGFKPSDYAKGKELTEAKIVEKYLGDFANIVIPEMGIDWILTAFPQSNGKRSEDIKDILDYYYRLKNVQDAYLRNFSEAELTENEHYQDFTTAINQMSQYVDDVVQQMYQENKLAYEIKNGIPETTEEYQKMGKAIRASAGANAELANSYDDLLQKDIGKFFQEETKKETKATKLFQNKVAIIKQTLSDLWNSDDFKSTKNKLIKASNTIAGITKKDINDIVDENDNLYAILQQNGMSAEYLANIFEDIAKNGTDGIDTLSTDGLRINEVLSEITDRTNEARQAYEDYNAALEGGDYNDLFENYQKAYESLGEMFDNQEFGEKFYRTVQYLFGEGHANDSIESLKKQYNSLKQVFGYDDNGLGFLEELNKHQNELAKLNSSVTKNGKQDFSFEFDSDEYSKIAKILGTTEEAVTSSIEALGMYGDFANYDINKLVETFSTLNVAIQGSGNTAVVNKAKIEDYLNTLGYEKWQVEQIIESVEGNKNLKLFDFDDTSKDNIATILNTIKDTIGLNGKNIDINSFANTLKNSLGMSSKETIKFASAVEKIGYKFIDNGKIVDNYKKKIKTVSTTDGVVELLGDLDKLKSKAKSAEKTLNNLYSEDESWKDLDINFDETNIKKIDSDIKNVQEIVDSFKDKKGIVDVSVEGATQAQTILATLIEQKQELQKPSIMTVNASKITGDGTLSKAVRELQEYQVAKENLEVKTKIGVDTKEAKKELNSKIKAIQDDDTFANALGLKVDFSNLDNDEIKKQLNEKIKNLNTDDLIKLGVDSSAIEGYKAEDKKATVFYDVDKKEVNKFINEYKDVKGTLTYSVGFKSNQKMLTIPELFKSQTTNKNDKARFTGTAYANGSGDWRIGSSGIALGGELGAELRVNSKTGRYEVIGQNSTEFFKYNPNDIIFNHLQTRELLQNGKITTGNKRGTLVGSAYAYGSTGRAFALTTGSTSNGGNKKREQYNSSKSSSKSSSASSSTTDKQLTAFQNWVKTIFDWIEVRLDSLSRKTNNWISKAEQAVDYSRKSSYYRKAINSASKEITENSRASNTYYKQAIAIAQQGVKKGLISSSTMNSALKKIENGSINLEAYSDKQREVIENVMTWYEKSIKSKDNILSLIKDIDSYYESLENLPIDKAAEKVEKLSNSFDILNAKLDNANSYKTKNRLLDNESKNMKQQANAQKSAAKQTKKSYNNAIRDVRGYNFGDYQSVVNKALSNGKQITVLNSWNENAIKTVTRYNKALEANRQAQNTAALATQNATKTLRENTKAKYDNIASYYEDTNNVTSAKVNKYGTQLAYRNSMGYSAVSSAQQGIYNNIIAEDEILLKSYQNERSKYNKSKLKKQYQSGKLSRADYMAQLAYIEELDEKILQTKADIADNQYELFNIKLTKYTNSLNKLEASATKLQDTISLNETKGIAATKEQYQGLIDNSQQQIENLNSQNELIRLQMRNYSVGSERYNELLSQYNENNSAILACKKSQEEYNQAIYNMPITQFENQLELLDAIAEKNKSDSEVKKSKGEYLSYDDYYTQIIDLKNQIVELNNLAATYQSYYDIASKSSDGVFDGHTADYWLEQVMKAQTEINGLTVSIEELKDELRDDVYWRDLEKAHDYAKKLETILEGISDLISNDMYFDKNGKFTQYGIAQIGVLTKQYENARKEVENYSTDIEHLNSLYANGYYTEDEYSDKLNELQEGLLKSASSMKSYIESIKNMYKEMEQNELDALFKIIDARQKALNAKKDYYSFDKTVSEKNKNIQSLNAELAALQGIETAEAKAQRAKLQAQLSEAQDDLDNTINDHIMDLSSQALDDLKTTLQDAFDDRWEFLFTNFDNIAELLATANTLTETQSQNIDSILSSILGFYGVNGNQTGIMSSGGFAKGTRRVGKSGNYWTQENGEEIIIRPSDGAILTPLKSGDGVLPANFTDNLFELGAYNPKKLIKQMTENMTMPKVSNNNIGGINVDISQNVNVQGDLTKATLPELKEILKLSSEYTQKQIINDARKFGKKI